MTFAPKKVEERRAEDADDDYPLALGAAQDFDGRGERRQREDAALAVVVRTQDEDAVLDRDDEYQRPEDEREDAEDVPGRRGDGVLANKCSRMAAFGRR